MTTVLLGSLVLGVMLVVIAVAVLLGLASLLEILPPRLPDGSDEDERSAAAAEPAARRGARRDASRMASLN